MRHGVYLLVVVVSLSLFTSSTRSADITWVSIVTDEVAGADVGFTDLLTGFGHNVTRFFSHTDLTLSEIDTLNESDLIIASRAVNSTEFDGNNALVWNEQITPPLIHMSGYATRQNRLGWFVGSNIPDSANAMLRAPNPNHPVFDSIAFQADGVTMLNDYNFVIDRGTSTPGNVPVAGGTVIAENLSTSPQGVAIAEWPAGTTVTDENGQSMELANNRYFFAGGSREASGNPVATAGMYDLTTDGLLLFFNMVNYALSGVGSPCDFTGDGLCTVDDINMLQQLAPLATDQPVSPSTAQFDLNDDNVVNIEDRNRWLEMAASENGLDAPYPLGDSDLNGVVNADDFANWNSNRFTNVSDWSGGDFNADARVDVQDFNLWNAHKSPAAGAAVVPEPHAILPALLAGLAALRLRRKA